MAPYRLQLRCRHVKSWDRLFWAKEFKTGYFFKRHFLQMKQKKRKLTLKETRHGFPPILHAHTKAMRDILPGSLFFPPRARQTYGRGSVLEFSLFNPRPHHRTRLVTFSYCSSSSPLFDHGGNRRDLRGVWRMIPSLPKCRTGVLFMHFGCGV